MGVCTLAINAGSSSIRFALFTGGKTARLEWRGKIDRIGSAAARLTCHDAMGNAGEERKFSGDDPASVAAEFLQWLESQPGFGGVERVGHRVVHGMERSAPERITPELMRSLRGLIPFDPDHLPLEIRLIEAVSERHPGLVQVACFDTAFHHSMPRVATLLPIPRRHEAKGARRYGFHGLSYAYLLEELERLGEGAARKGKIILAHLGNGASLAAVRDGRSVETTMGFTPASGLMMGTRTGDIDPGLVSFLARTEGMTAEQFDSMVNHESGLLGVSGSSSDMRDLLAAEGVDERAREAVALFCYQAKKGIGALAAVLGGLDLLVFAGGIGEHHPAIRERICAGLDFLGIELDRGRNEASAELISSGRVRVRVMATDEEWMIARLAWDAAVEEELHEP